MTRNVILMVLALQASSMSVTFAQSVERISLDQAADRIRGSTQPTVVAFYKTTCPISRAMLPTLVSLARDHGAGAQFLVFSVGDDSEAGAVPGFLATAMAPFGAVHVSEWPSGAFIRTMRTFGVDVGKTWTTPLVIVRDGRGRTVASREGVADVSGLARVLSTIR